MNEINRLRNRWKHMRERCRNPKRNDYKYYGGRGIKVCKEWDNFYAFKSWFDNAAMIYRRWNSEEDVMLLEVDRYKHTGNYCPSNCRLITHRDNVMRAIQRDKNGRFVKHNN